MRKWRVEDSAELYNIGGWGRQYFSVNEKGNMTVTPRPGVAPVDIREVLDELQLKDITAPVLLRFPDILDNRVEKISNCFKQAAKEYDYQGQNYVIYPIKVNQMRPVVEEIVSHGKKFNIGLEAGSKPELHAVLATNIDENALIICNGYKDEDYIELALLAHKMGRRIVLVVEKLNELKLILNISRRLKITPAVGIRIKLSNSGSGKWEESGGDESKFGLNSSELLQAVDFFKKNEITDWLQLIHFHIGSQITKIRRIKNALREAMQFYVQLSKLGFGVKFVDIGGGLGVDYDGTRSSASESSMNYSIQEYANDAIYSIVDACGKNDLPQPDIITESGRSLAAHHSVLIIEALEATSLPRWRENEELRKVARMLPDKYYCNFSLFQSLPDSWAIDQVFPIVPISRLDEKPTRMATLQDMTCDSDGKIATFISPQGITKALPVHPLKPGEPYYLGVFLVGAYQEILGDMHNLFGDTNAVHITCYKDHYEIDKVIDGETVAEVLDYVQYDPKRLVRNVETWVTKAMKADKITPEEGREFLSNYRSGLYGYTYLEND